MTIQLLHHYTRTKAQENGEISIRKYVCTHKKEKKNVLYRYGSSLLSHAQLFVRVSFHFLHQKRFIRRPFFHPRGRPTGFFLYRRLKRTYRTTRTTIYYNLHM